MGIRMAYLSELDAAGLFQGERTRVLDIGSQNLYLAGTEAVFAFLRNHTLQRDDTELRAKAEDLARRSYSNCPKTLTYVSELFDRTTIDYQAIDIFEAPRTRIVDLNFERLPRDLRGRFDLGSV